MSLLQACNGGHKYDIVCLSETYQNSSIPYDDKNLLIPGYNLIRADHLKINAAMFVFTTKIQYL